MGRVIATRSGVRLWSSFREGGHCTVQAAFLTEKPDFTIGIASNEADDDCFFLAALEAIDATQFNTGESFLQGGQNCELNETNPVSDLPA